MRWGLLSPLVVSVVLLSACGGSGEASDVPISGVPAGSSGATIDVPSDGDSPSDGGASPADGSADGVPVDGGAAADPEDAPQPVGPPDQVGADPQVWAPVNLSAPDQSNVFLVIAGQSLAWQQLPEGLSSMVAVSSDDQVALVIPNEATGIPVVKALSPGRATVSVFESAADAAFAAPVLSVEVVVIARPREGVVTAVPVDVSRLEPLTRVVLVPQELALWAEPFADGEPYVVTVGNELVVEPVSVLTGEGSVRVPGVRGLAPGGSTVVWWDGVPGEPGASVVLELWVEVVSAVSPA